MQVGLSVGHLYVGSLGGVTGVGGDPSLPLNGVRGKKYDMIICWLCERNRVELTRVLYIL